MLTIIAWIVVFGVLVAVHELGHYLVAKSFGMQVDEYSLGFGPSLWSRRWGGTQYSLRVIPLGGYVRLGGMDGEKTTDPDEFPNRPLWQRFLVIFAGPVMNLVLAFVLYAIVFGPIGMPVVTATVQHVMAHYPAEMAGLRAGDRIVSIDGQRVANGTAVSQLIASHAHQWIQVGVVRHHRYQVFRIKPRWDPSLKRYLIGIQLGMATLHLGLWASLKQGVVQTVQLTGAWFVALYKLVTGQSAFDLMGPVGIAVTIGQAAAEGWFYLFVIAAALSANLGLFNILPVPVLDGSRLFFLGLEGIRRRALDPERESLIHLVGMVFLLLFVVFVTYHDLVHYLHLG
ncbi:MAG: M50 family metallopeptidase [Firmicutes bacterium]|nr:M50 family metallopeptidase [Bacillota bacterium]